MMAVLIYVPLVKETDEITIKHWIYVEKENTEKFRDWLQKKQYNLPDEPSLKLNDWLNFQLETGVPVKIFAQPASSVVIVKPGILHQVISTGYGTSVAHNLLNDSCIKEFITANEVCCLPSSPVWKESNMFGSECFVVNLIESLQKTEKIEELKISIDQNPKTMKLVKSITKLGNRIICGFKKTTQWKPKKKEEETNLIVCSRCEREIWNLIAKCGTCERVLCTWCYGRNGTGLMHDDDNCTSNVVNFLHKEVPMDKIRKQIEKIKNVAPEEEAAEEEEEEEQSESDVAVQLQKAVSSRRRIVAAK